MSAQPIAQRQQTPVEIVSRWWRAWTANRSAGSDFACCAEGQVEQLAKDMGVSAGDLRALARLGPGAADLLQRRMTALKLDRSEVLQAEPGTFQDMQRVCAMCGSHKRCARDMTRNAKDSAWEDYCSNVATLKMLNAMPWPGRSDQ